MFDLTERQLEALDAFLDTLLGAEEFTKFDGVHKDDNGNEWVITIKRRSAAFRTSRSKAQPQDLRFQAPVRPDTTTPKEPTQQVHQSKLAAFLSQHISGNRALPKRVKALIAEGITGTSVNAAGALPMYPSPEKAFDKDPAYRAWVQDQIEYVKSAQLRNGKSFDPTWAANSICRIDGTSKYNFLNWWAANKHTYPNGGWMANACLKEQRKGLGDAHGAVTQQRYTQADDDNGNDVSADDLLDMLGDD